MPNHEIVEANLFGVKEGIAATWEACRNKRGCVGWEDLDNVLAEFDMSTCMYCKEAGLPLVDCMHETDSMHNFHDATLGDGLICDDCYQEECR